MRRNDYIFVLMLFLVWRFGLFFISAQAKNLLRFQPSFPYVDVILMRDNVPNWLRSWANFDGVHYIVIGDQGYSGHGLVQAFFPLYPVLLGLLRDVISISIILIGVVLSSLFFLGALFFLYDLLRLVYNVSFARRTLLILVCFPTSFYFGAVYSESLFLFLLSLIFWASYHRKWWLVAVLNVFASANRLVGLFIIPATIVQLWLSENLSQKVHRFSLSKHLLAATTIQLLGLTGLIGYMVFLWSTFGDPLLFFHVQSEFGGGRQEELILLPQIMWRYFKMIAFLPMSLVKYSIIQEFAMTMGGGLLLALGVKLKDRLQLSWQMLIFSLGAFFLPTLTGTFSSMPRYVLVCLPMYIVLSFLLKKKVLLIPYLVGSIFLLVFNTVLFVQGYWVA